MPVNIPSLETARLLLLPPAEADFEGYASIVTTERGRFIGGPLSREDAWLDYAQMVASWMFRGYGALTVKARDDGRYLGTVLVNHEFGDPEPELGWLFVKGAEGKGLAFEAGAAMLEWAWANTALTTVVSYMDPENTRAMALAARLGGRQVSGPAGVVTYRYRPSLS